MFVLCGLRDVFSLGIDSKTSYIRLFREVGALDWAEVSGYSDSNQGFNYILKLFHTLTMGDYQAFYILYSAFIMGVFGWFISKYSVNPIQSFCYFWGLLCYIFLFDSIKQGIAMAFVTLAFDAIIGRRPVLYGILCAAAWWVHAPALIFAPAYLIAEMKPGRLYLLFLAAMLALTFRFREEILELMLRYY
jgi:hypothetical protein